MELGAGSDAWGKVFWVGETSRLPVLIHSMPPQCAHQEDTSHEESPKRFPFPQSDIPRSFRVTPQMRMDARSYGFDFRVMCDDSALDFCTTFDVRPPARLKGK